MSSLIRDRPQERAGESSRGAINREIEPPLDLGLPYWFHLFFPDRLLSTELRILVIGCEDEMALRLARANPRARVTAVDDRAVSLEAAAQAREQRSLSNLELLAGWPPEPRSGAGFDLVYYNAQTWPGEPSVVLEQAAELLRPDGSLHLTLRAGHAWTGVRTVCELLEQLGIQPNSAGYPRALQIVAALGREHPWNLLGAEPPVRPDDLLADWLRPAEPCFSVPQVYGLLAGSGLTLQRFTYQAYYLPQCSSALARTPLLAEVRQLPLEQQQALMELYWPALRHHLLVACRGDRPAATFETGFTGQGWLRYVPLLPARLPVEPDESPVGAKARLCWRAAGMPEVGLSLGGFQYRLLQALDRGEELGDVIGLAGLSGDPELRDAWAGDFFQLMADYDFLHFRTRRAADCEPLAEVDLEPLVEANLELLQQEYTEAADEAEPAAAGAPAESPQQLWRGELETPFVEAAVPQPPPDAASREPALEPRGMLVEPRGGVMGDAVMGDAVIGDSAATPRSTVIGDSAREQDRIALQGHSAALAANRPGPAVDGGVAGAPGQELAAQLERIPYEACPLCGEAGYQPFRKAEADVLVGSQLVRVPVPWMRCGRCTHVFTAGYFAGEIWGQILDALLAERGTLQQAVARRAQASRIVSAVTALRERAAGRWLDVGCSHSGLIAVAAEYGYDCVGVDCCRQGAERLGKLGYAVRTGSVFDCNDGPYDVVSLSGLLDRMPFPSQALGHVRRLLGPGGLVFLSALSSDSLAWRNLDFNGVNPYWARAERYHNFDRKSVFRLVQEAGFDPCSYGVGAPEPVGMEVVACCRR